MAQDAAPTDLQEIVVESEAEDDELVQGPFLPDVQGTKIYAGKKTSIVDLDKLPEITNNNYRQAFATTPGLLVSEEASPLVSIGYRGLDPHRAQFMQVLKDGIPIHADQFGYPEAYYTPPLDTVDRIEFLRGGAALIYGPQPGGALNYITHRPRLDRPFSFGTKHTFGSDNYYSSFTHVDGTTGRLGYYGYYNRRQSDGFRTTNSDYDLNAGHFKLVLDGDTSSRWILAFDAYEETHGEPGGLTFATGPGAVNYNENRDGASRLFDTFELKRYVGSLTWEKDFSEDTKLNITGWGGYYSRYSSRQRGGGFGILPSGPDADTTSVEMQEFYTFGLDARLRHDYTAFGGEHTLSPGFQVYHTDSPREDRRGDSKDARGGVLRNKNDREVWYAPVFVENLFRFGRLSITPGVRFENIWQGVEESVNVERSASGIALADESEYNFVPLFGLGVEYEVAPKVSLYGNVSQSYRPAIFSQAVPTGGTVRVPDDLEESKAWQYELGFRGAPTSWVNWDVSTFLLDFDDQIGSITQDGGFSTLANVGRAQHRGVEAAVEFDVIGFIDHLRGGGEVQEVYSGKDKTVVPTAAPSLVERFGSLSLYGNAMLLDAEFVSGPLDGFTPRYAPDYVVRAGVIYRWQDRVKVAFLGTFVGDHFADDSNTEQRAVPGYMVWDLTAEANVYKDIVSVHAGINNIFNEDYYARVRDDGIDPAQGRNYYVGVGLKF
jgi:Fe(3+) dicitrate transport protein